MSKDPHEIRRPEMLNANTVDRTGLVNCWCECQCRMLVKRTVQICGFCQPQDGRPAEHYYLQERLDINSVIV